MTEALPTAYSPTDIEERWYGFWEENGFFHPEPDPNLPSWSLVIPPPNVTGSLHMGHAFGDTQMDIYARRARLQGKNTLFLYGSDHAGIATQNVVERELAKEGTDRNELGREAFIERVWAWRQDVGGNFREQLRRLGVMCDWGRERFTMDEGLSKAVRTVFVRWFEDGLIYRGNRIINWCPFHETALSDIEVEHEDAAGEIVTFRYDFADGSGSIPVATTRVETMLGDTGVAVHPDDERYKNAIGRKLVHPFFADRDLPVVADEAVEPEFGTGAVKVTPAHDPTDFEIGERAGLVEVNIFDAKAVVNENGGSFQGLDRYAARKAVLEALQERGFVEKVERPYVHAVGHCYRCHTEVEPWLSEQWFVSMKPLAGPAIDVVENGRVNIVPKRFAKQYIDWMNNVRDWCISRQIWWGHRIPVWYCEDCDAVIAALDDPAECSKCSSRNLVQDPDVLDTWFSSQLWPFSTLGWPDDTPEMKAFYPTSLMVTGYEILYLWVARMIFSALYFTNDIPFKDVLIHGIVRDRAGKKMSKSLGNVIDPLDLIDRFGADALRFSLASTATSGNDVNFSEDRIEGARNFANKLWNASRFVLMSLGDERPGLPADTELGEADRWILARLDDTISEYERQLASRNLAEAMRTLHQFIWSEFCDWYIELAKMRLDAEDAECAKGVLIHVLDTVLRALHPVMPFLTEEIWSRLRPEAGSIMTAGWPVSHGRKDPQSVAMLERLQDLVTSLRRAKAERSVPPGKRVPALIVAHGFKEEIEQLRPTIVTLARLASINLVDSLPTEGTFARTITDAGIEAALDLGDLVDVEDEKAKLAVRIKEMVSEIDRASKKLSNESFVGKAPADVVAKERAKLDEYRATKDKLEAQLKALG